MFATSAIILIALHLSSAKHENLTKNYKFPNKELVLSEASFNNATLFYASCEQSPKQCTVIHETNPFNRSTVTAKCEVNLKSDNVQLLVGSRKQKAIFITVSKSSMVQATIVNMSSCKSVEMDIVEVPSDWSNIQLYYKYIDVVVFEKSFDVIIKGLSNICSEPDRKIYCSFTFDYEGKKIGGPTVWPKMYYDEMDIVSPILPAVSGEWYFFVKREDSLSALLVDRHGGPEYERMYKMPKVHLDIWKEGYSTTNNAHGMCYDLMNSTIGCWQMGVEGRKLITEFTFKHQHQTAKLSVHNLRSGGFIILLITCPEQICSGIEDHYYLLKVDAQGKFTGHVNVEVKSQCNAKNSDILAKVFENDQGQYCAVRLCKSHTHEEGRLETSIDCFSNNDFTQ
ncbi:uncharacterized protein LOC131669900 [Phymastichus coffea]|uniref:uncharacterized protein LOC131669900 n=1 Tax=Phymastichus coffea TaxID=108790 RepID=UPI00273CBF1C|nr:uncharacterized protein LOC131669900 [Phymastichus coffea]